MYVLHTYIYIKMVDLDEIRDVSINRNPFIKWYLGV